MLDRAREHGKSARSRKEKRRREATLTTTYVIPTTHVKGQQGTPWVRAWFGSPRMWTRSRRIDAMNTQKRSAAVRRR